MLSANTSSTTSSTVSFNSSIANQNCDKRNKSRSNNLAQTPTKSTNLSDNNNQINTNNNNNRHNYHYEHQHQHHEHHHHHCAIHNKKRQLNERKNFVLIDRNLLINDCSKRQVMYFELVLIILYVYWILITIRLIAL
jgi:hypothetical protein